MDEIEAKVLKYIGWLSITEPSLDESFINLGIRGIDIIKLLVLIREDFNVRISEKDFPTINNGRDLVNYIRQHPDIEKKYQIPPDLRDKLVKYFSTIEELADELTTANVSHKKSYIKGVAGRAKEYLIKHT